METSRWDECTGSQLRLKHIAYSVLMDIEWQVFMRQNWGLSAYDLSEACSVCRRLKSAHDRGVNPV